VLGPGGGVVFVGLTYWHIINMLQCMRTTVRLDDDLLRQVKQYAAEEDMTLTAVIHQALRELLARRRRLAEQERTPLPSFSGQGLQPGVDLDDSAALLELMERGDAPA
jgi:Arc/MetJ family transcription regulator